ncbi:MAG: hypothetical protein E7048_01415 [Lentisphaerae bacterium]|nr:hypothetical protein [Lentisphaerota bacterium]
MFISRICTVAALLSAFVLCGAEPQIKVALAGSSACQSYEGGLRPKEMAKLKADKSREHEFIYGWGEFVGQYFNSNVKVLNFAISGRSTKTFLERGDWAKLLKSKPDYILMTLGANDTPPKKQSTDIPTYKKNLRRFAADAKAIGAKMIFVTINQALTRSAKNVVVFRPHGPWVKSRVPYSQAMHEVAKELNLPCLELAENQRKIYEAMGEKAAGALYCIRATGKMDGSHTNKAGAELIAKIIITELRKSNSDLKKYTKDPKFQYPVKKAAKAQKK